MIFQTLDDKGECVGVYADGELTMGSLPDGLTKTWSYAPYLKGLDVKYARLYCGGASLQDACPSDLTGEWDYISNRLKAYLRSFINAKVSLDENCFFDLVPHRFLMEYCDIKSQISKHVFDTHDEPANYRFLADLQELTTEIASRPLKIDPSLIDRASPRSRRLWQRMTAQPTQHIKYNIFGTKTGRLGLEQNSFPILNLDKRNRKIIKPTNDYFVELDYNAAELRVLLALSGKDQPAEDIHDWNLKNVYRGAGTREKAKERIFAWLYNPESDAINSDLYNRDKILSNYYVNGKIQTPAGRSITVEERKAFNYLIQSTTADLVMERAIEIDKFLVDKKSFISHIVHDEIVIDLHDSERTLAPLIKNIFENNSLGQFRSNINAGKNYYDLKELVI